MPEDPRAPRAPAPTRSTHLSPAPTCLSMGRKGPCVSKHVPAPSPKTSPRNPQHRVAGPAQPNCTACKPTRAHSFPRGAPFLSLVPRAEGGWEPDGPTWGGVRPEGEGLGHSTKCGLTSGQQQHRTWHRAPRTRFPDGCPPTARPACLPHSRVPCPQRPAQLCLISRKIPTRAREMARH